MYVRVFIMMVMFMIVNDVTMSMHVTVGTIPSRPAEPPREVHQAKREQRPPGEVAPHAFDLD